MRWVHAAQPRMRGNATHLYRKRRRDGVLLCRCAAVVMIFIAALIISSVLFAGKVRNGAERSGHSNLTTTSGGVGIDHNNNNNMSGTFIAPGPPQASSSSLLLLKSKRFERVVTPYARENEKLVGDGSSDLLTSQSVDIHLFVIWKAAVHARKRILEDMAESFVILDVARFDWISPQPLETESVGEVKGKEQQQQQRSTLQEGEHEDVFLLNLWRLYSGKGGWDRETSMDLKVKQCGRGKFIAVIVADVNPVYETKHTAHGDDYVNHKMHTKKAQYRKMGGAQFSVHGTYDSIEADHDIRMLMHVSTSVYSQEFMAVGQEELKLQGRELVHRYLESPERFTVSVDTYGIERKNITKIVWPTCDALLFALETVPDVAVVEGSNADRTADEGWREPLWISRSAKSMADEEEGEKKKKSMASIGGAAVKVGSCSAWPSTLTLYVPDTPSLYSVASIMMGERQHQQLGEGDQRAGKGKVLDATLSDVFHVSIGDAGGQEVISTRITLQVVSDSGFRTWLKERRISPSAP